MFLFFTKITVKTVDGGRAMQYNPRQTNRAHTAEFFSKLFFLFHKCFQKPFAGQSAPQRVFSCRFSAVGKARVHKRRSEAAVCGG